MTLVIMAAGMGSRFGGLKQIEPINENGEFIIDYSIYDAIKAGFNKVVFIIKKENYEIFKDTVGKRIENQIEVEYVFQELDKLPEGFSCPEDRVKPWGTGHAILCVKDVVTEPFVIINADDFYGRDAYIKAAEFLKNIKKEEKLQAAMIGYRLCNTVTENGSVKRGICKANDNKLVELIESKIEQDGGKFTAYPLEDETNSFEVSNNALVSMNMFAFSNEIFEYLEKSFIEFLKENGKELTKEFYIPSFVFELIKKDIMEVSVIETNAKWLGVTYKEDKDFVVSEIKKLHEQKIYDEKLWN